MATLATPGTAISLGRMVHLASSERSICESFGDVTPIFITRLRLDNGERITGGLTTAGKRLEAIESRSATSCRATIRSVPSLKIRTTDDRPSTDFDRRIFKPVVPLSEFSSGTLTKASTSSVERPGASVWISTSGGANSGKTSSGAF